MPLALKFSCGFIGLTVLILSAWSYAFGGGGDTEPAVDRPDSAQVDTPDTPAAGAIGPQGPGKAAGAGNATGDSPPYSAQSTGALGLSASQVNIAPATQAVWISGVLRLSTLASAPNVQSAREPVLPAVASSEALEVSVPPSPDSSGQPGEVPLPLPETNQDDVIPAPTSSPVGRTYRVMAGDDAATIAAKHCAVDPPVWIKELLDINDLQEDELTTGMILQLPETTPLLCSTPTPGARSPSLAPVVAAATPTPTPASAP
jgi:hypothetical protein